MNHHPSNPNRDELDQQIREALRVEPSPERIARLERIWHESVDREPMTVFCRNGSSGISRKRRLSLFPAAAISAALVAAVCVGIGLWQNLQDDVPRAHRLPLNVANQGTRTQPREPQKVVVAVNAPQNVAVESSLSAGRAPTIHERVLFAARSRWTAKLAAGATSGLAAAEPSPVPSDEVDQLIDRLLDDKNADVEQLVAASVLSGHDVEERLLRRLVLAADTQKCAIIRLLAVCGTRRAVSTLLEFGQREPLRGEALDAVERIVGADQLHQLVRETGDRSMRAALMRRLLKADSDGALRGYLSLVADRTTQAESLAAAEKISGPLLEKLLALLDDEDQNVRFSAALVLGHGDGPEVAASLVALVARPATTEDEDARRTEAWMALMACRDRQTGVFLAQAMYQPKLLKHLNRARVQWERMTLGFL